MFAGGPPTKRSPIEQYGNDCYNRGNWGHASFIRVSFTNQQCLTLILNPASESLTTVEDLYNRVLKIFDLAHLKVTVNSLAYTCARGLISI